MSLTLTPAEVKSNYPNSVLIKLTDDSRSGVVDDTILQACIDRAYTTLKSLVDVEDTTYLEADLKNWWIDLTLYRLYQRIEKEEVARDKKQAVEEEIKSYKQNQSADTGIDSDFEEADLKIGFASSDALLSSDTIKKWDELTWWV